jgi:RNA polymerase sigma factor (sigma-70 family)
LSKDGENEAEGKDLIQKRASCPVITMGLSPDSRTHATLLGRLYRSGRADNQAWNEFVEVYGRQIYKWCRHWQLQDADAQEVTQQVLTDLLAKMQDFVYDPTRSFRAWLKTVSHHAWRNLFTSRRYAPLGEGGSGVQHQLLTVPARDDLLERLEKEFDLELLEKASVNVRLRVAPHTWEAFRLTALDGIAAPEAAQRLDMKIANVYAARSSVGRMLRQEMARLDSAAPED